MKVKIYNTGGVVRITKVSSKGVESNMFHLSEGEIAEIELEANLCVEGKKVQENMKNRLLSQRL